jgi:NAD-dependent deacetylase
VLDEALEAAIGRLAPVAARAQRITVLTGAGVSAESGIPTFRDAQTGLWARYDPVMLASYEGFLSDPVTVWKWYDERRAQMRQSQPNPGHLALAQWQQRWRELGRSFTLITQNIDDLHGRAGSTGIIELHGNIWLARPLDGAHGEARRLDECPLAQCPPYDAQGRLLRPHVVWFGEMLDPLVLEAAFNAATHCDLMFVVGTSSQVYPAAALPHAARRNRATLVEVNPHPTDLTGGVNIALCAPSGVALPALWERVQESLTSSD